MQDTLVTPAPQPLTVERSFGDQLQASFADAFGNIFRFIPRLLAFLVILLVGWYLANLVARATVTILRAVRFNELTARTGVGDFMTRAQMGADVSSAVAGLVKWVIRVVVLLVAFDTLGLPAVSDVLRQFLLWLPNLVVALVILFVAGVAARGASNIAHGATAEAGFSNPETLARIARTAVWAFTIVFAVNQIGIASSLINTLFMGVVGALALAAGLAFGLGGRDLASNVLDDWYGRTRGGRPRIETEGEK